MPEYNAGVSDDRSYRRDHKNRQSFSGGYEGVGDSNIQAPPQWSFSDSMCEAGMVFGMMIFFILRPYREANAGRACPNLSSI